MKKTATPIHVPDQRAEVIKLYYVKVVYLFLAVEDLIHRHRLSSWDFLRPVLV